MRVTTLLFTLAATGMPLVIASGPAPSDFAGLAPQVQAQAELDRLPPPSWLPDDPADSLYRAAREALRRNEFARAADLFHQVRERYPRSGYAPEAYYWEAFSLYRGGSQANLRLARSILKQQLDRFPAAYHQGGDPEALAVRICGALAAQGDAECAALIQKEAGNAATSGTGSDLTSSGQCPNEDDDMRIAALNAVLQMDEDRAVPLLKRVLARRDACSAVLRRKAIFLVSQKQTPETEDILLSAARSDPDDEVRQQAVFWLSQVGTDKAVTALDSILRTSADPEIQKKAIFALSQVDNARAAATIRAYAERNDAPSEVREQAIFWLGQQNNADNARYLQTLYGKLTDPELKKKVIFSLSQMDTPENLRWIMSVALDEHEDIEMRKQALFWAGQQGAAMEDLVGLYSRMTNQEMKEQLIFVYSQREEKAAVDKLVDIARNDPNRELRKKALFWLSQSNDPRVVDILQQIIDQ
jgi:HEAT repeat protein